MAGRSCSSPTHNRLVSRAQCHGAGAEHWASPSSTLAPSPQSKVTCPLATGGVGIGVQDLAGNDRGGLVKEKRAKQPGGKGARKLTEQTSDDPRRGALAAAGPSDRTRWLVVMGRPWCFRTRLGCHASLPEAWAAALAWDAVAPPPRASCVLEPLDASYRLHPLCWT